MIIQTVDTSVSAESCEELFIPINPSSGVSSSFILYLFPGCIFCYIWCIWGKGSRLKRQQLGLAGCEILVNGSASHAELQKLRARLDLIKNATRKLGGVYICEFVHEHLMLQDRVDN